MPPEIQSPQGGEVNRAADVLELIEGLKPDGVNTDEFLLSKFLLTETEIQALKLAADGQNVNSEDLFNAFRKISKVCRRMEEELRASTRDQAARVAEA